MNEREVSEGGSLIYRHKTDKNFEIVNGDQKTIDAVEKHIMVNFLEAEIGVFHEIISDKIHIDLFFVRPKHGNLKDRILVITCGMSSKPMTVPVGAEKFKFAELFMILPSNWPIGVNEFENEDNYWPIRNLKILARLPIEYSTWLFDGHTIPLENNSKSSSRFVGSLISIPNETEESFFTLNNGDFSTHFYQVIPITQNEMDYKLKYGNEALQELIFKEGVDKCISAQRPELELNSNKGWIRKLLRL